LAAVQVITPKTVDFGVLPHDLRLVAIQVITLGELSDTFFHGFFM
jgi:hypothetical protein